MPENPGHQILLDTRIPTLRHTVRLPEQLTDSIHQRTARLLLRLRLLWLLSILKRILLDRTRRIINQRLNIRIKPYTVQCISRLGDIHPIRLRDNPLRQFCHIPVSPAQVSHHLPADTTVLTDNI